MADTSLTERAPARAPAGPRTTTWERVLGRPVAFLMTALIVLLLFSWTFITNSERVAPTKDPAYYTWRAELLISDDPVRLLEVEGPKVEGAGGLFASGYRVAAPILGGLLRRIPAVAPLSTTVFLMVGIPVLTALLLAAFAYQQRGDPLVFHAVALGSASLYLTPPFVGYLDNILCLFFLAAALFFIRPSRESWGARIAFGAFLVLAGLTHPTTLVIFGLVLGAMSGLRLLFRRFDVRSVLRDDGPMLASALVAALVVYAIWTTGIWGKSVALNEAALPPPYERDFFVDRLVLWIKAMRPFPFFASDDSAFERMFALNGFLFLLGAGGLLAAGRRAVEDDLARVSIVWLAPLAGVFGFLAGLSYPYYRFFNTTLAWVLLVGLGIFFAARYCINRARAGGASRLALLGLVVLAFVVGTNFNTGFRLSGWNNVTGGWLSASQREELDFLAAALNVPEARDRPIVFVVDDEDTSPRIYGFTKLSGNTSRFALNHGNIDQGYVYLGSLENFVEDRPTVRGQETYDDLSRAALDEIHSAVEETGKEPLAIVASAFNETGANAALLDPGAELPAAARESDVWLVRAAGDVSAWSGGDAREIRLVRHGREVFLEDFFTQMGRGGPVLHLLRALVGFVLLLVPGLIAFRYFLPTGRLAHALGMVPALSLALNVLAALVVLALVRMPMWTGVAWGSLGLATVVAALLAGRPRLARLRAARA